MLPAAARICGLALAILILWLAPGQAQSVCPSCDRELALSAAEWACLAESIDRFLRVRADPVLVPFVQCGSQRSLDATRSDPLIAPRGSQGGAESYRRALRLSKVQLQCLKARLHELTAAPPALFNFEQNCAQD
jgi:hypothetical protein